MTDAQLTAWQAFYQISPFGDYRGDIQAGVIASTLANTFRGKGETPRKIEDFIPFRKNRSTVISEEEIVDKINRFMKRYH